MSSTWLADTTANRYIKTYFNGFIDVSGGDIIQRSGNIDLSGGNIILNGSSGFKKNGFSLSVPTLTANDSLATQSSLNSKANLVSPSFTGTVSGITKTMVGLSNVDDTTDLLKPVSTATQTALILKANLESPTFTGTVSGIDKTMVGLSSVDNTTDLLKPVSTATQTALDLKANLESPTFTGTVSAPTAAVGTGTSQLATCQFVIENIDSETQAKFDAKANLDTPIFTGTVSAEAFYNTITQSGLATYSWVNSQLLGYLYDGISSMTAGIINATSVSVVESITADSIAANSIVANSFNLSSGSSLLSTNDANSIYSQKNSPNFTGTPSAPTAAAGTNTTQLATCQFVLTNQPSLSSYWKASYYDGVIASSTASKELITNIPIYTRRITVLFMNMNGASSVKNLQVANENGVYATSGYNANYVNFTTGANDVYNGTGQIAVAMTNLSWSGKIIFEMLAGGALYYQVSGQVLLGGTSTSLITASFQMDSITKIRLNGGTSNLNGGQYRVIMEGY